MRRINKLLKAETDKMPLCFLLTPFENIGMLLTQTRSVLLNAIHVNRTYDSLLQRVRDSHE